MPTPALRQPLSHSGLFHPHSSRILSVTRVPAGCGTRTLRSAWSTPERSVVPWADSQRWGSGSAVLSGAGLKAAPWLRLREDAVVMEERQAPRCSTPVTLLRLPRGRALLTAFQTPRAASSSSSGKRGCAHLPAEGSVPPGQSQSSPMFHTQGQSRGLMLQNRGSASWPRGTSCFVLITAVLREGTQASPLHPPYTHSGCSFCCGFGPRSLMATPARCLGAALGAS